ncbi:MAG: hypothetical protein B1H03_01555 [Planctomycetales bacterium 4484_113]|nr:MAG: hypothetical protein B1H03_01555 [Planctomycetales bacterium 4484_113]
MSALTGRYEILLSGSGGQGIILSGIVLAEAGIAEGRKVVQTASYGPESRGGASRSQVILSREEIDYPGVISPNFVFVLTQLAADKYAHTVSPQGFVLADSSWVEAVPQNLPAPIIALRLSEEAASRFGMALFANVIGLGFFIERSGVLRAESVTEALARRVPKHYREANLEAFTFGRELAKQQSGQ